MQDIEFLYQSKSVLYNIIEGYPMLTELLVILVYNKKPNLQSKTVQQDDKKVAKEIFNHEEIKQINNQWTDNPFN